MAVTPDLKTTYLGLHLKSPLVASASPLSKKLDTARQVEDAGASALVMHSLFEEEIRHESMELDFGLNQGSESYAESLSFIPEVGEKHIGSPEPYLEQIQRLKEALNIPIIASLNGNSAGGWIDYAHQIEEAGADAIELNLYAIPTDVKTTGAELEAHYVELAQKICSSIGIPVAIKLSPFFTSIPNITKRFADAGAHGLVLFNRFYQPDLNLEDLTVVPNLELSTSRELRLPLRWIAILYSYLDVDFALTSGVHSGQDVVKAIMAGASVAMMTSALLENGPKWITRVQNELQAWMVEHEYDTISMMKGSMSQRKVEDPAAFERANYIKALNTFGTYLP
jgi:Dihydroorotate dehydrogenase